LKTAKYAKLEIFSITKGSDQQNFMYLEVVKVFLILTSFTMSHGGLTFVILQKQIFMVRLDGKGCHVNHLIICS